MKKTKHYVILIEAEVEDNFDAKTELEQRNGVQHNTVIRGIVFKPIDVKVAEVFYHE